MTQELTINYICSLRRIKRRVRDTVFEKKQRDQKEVCSDKYSALLSKMNE